MIAQYIQTALDSARYEIIEDKEPFYAEVKALPGVWATGKTLEECRRNLAEVVEGWILVRVRRGLAVRPLKGCRVAQPRKIAAYAYAHPCAGES